MASFQQHCADTTHFLGEPFPEVHSWMDECFKNFGPLHRKERHHYEGIRTAGNLFGPRGRLAAAIHVLRDCRHIPAFEDYRTGIVDALGLKKQWSTASYIRYNDKDFEDLVREHLEPTALLLWSFLSWEDAITFLSSTTHLDDSEILELRPVWEASIRRLSLSPQIEAKPESFLPLNESEHANDEVGAYLKDVHSQVVNAEDSLESEVGFIDPTVLGNAFVYIDYELLEDLKAELNGLSPIEVATFALPKKIGLPMSAVGDAFNQKTITFISRQKTMTVSDVRLRQSDHGTEVSFLISASSSGIVASSVGGNFLLRNGIHRAYLLARSGVKKIPCVVVREKTTLPVISASYTTFAPNVLMQSRHPMLCDFLDADLCLQAPMRRTNRLIRISAEAINIPVD